LQFQWPSNTDFELCIDDLAFTSAEGTQLSEGPSGTPKAGTFLASGGGGCACTMGEGGSHGPGALLGLTLIGLLVGRRRTG
jgi:MYXO-CTERM domain-containing protein